MHLFAYPKAWADVVTAQIATSRGSRDTQMWGYGCIVVGREFEQVVENQWLDVDRVSGSFLHVFCLVPPPLDFVAERLRQIRSKPSTADTEYVKGLLQDALTIRAPERGTQIREKVQLLQDLKNAGLEFNEFADFLFFSFSNEHDDVNIDVIAARAVRIGSEAKPVEILHVFERMGAIAAECHSKSSTAEEFVNRLDWDWRKRIVLQMAPDLLKYVTDFISALRGG